MSLFVKPLQIFLKIRQKLAFFKLLLSSSIQTGSFSFRPFCDPRTQNGDEKIDFKEELLLTHYISDYCWAHEKELVCPLFRQKKFRRNSSYRISEFRKMLSTKFRGIPWKIPHISVTEFCDKLRRNSTENSDGIPRNSVPRNSAGHPN